MCNNVCVAEYMTHFEACLRNLKPRLKAPPVSCCGQMRPGCQALHPSPLLMLILMLTLATVLVSLYQPHAIPLARAKSKTDSLLTQMALLCIHYIGFQKYVKYKICIYILSNEFLIAVKLVKLYSSDAHGEMPGEIHLWMLASAKEEENIQNISSFFFFFFFNSAMKLLTCCKGV